MRQFSPPIVAVCEALLPYPQRASAPDPLGRWRQEARRIRTPRIDRRGEACRLALIVMLLLLCEDFLVWSADDIQSLKVVSYGP